MQAKLIKQLPVANQLGEGVTWDQQTGCVWWVDILSSKLFCYSLVGDELKEWNTPEPLCSFALVAGRDDLLAGFASGIAWYKPNAAASDSSDCGSQGDVQWIQKIEPENQGTRLNDGKADLQGNFWVGGARENESAAPSALYRLDANLGLNTALEGIVTSNGLCWSPCGQYVYHTDTPSRTIRRYDLGTNGDLSSGVDFAKTDDGCFPDGSTTDSQGRVYNAEWGGSKVRCYTPGGDIDFDLIMPISQPTCVAFAGDDLSLLVVTSAAVGTEDEVGAGDLYIYQTDRAGFHHPRFGEY